jgi:hypothetical protein
MFVAAQPTNSSCIIERGYRRSVLGIIVVASLLSGFLSSVPASAQPKPPTSAEPTGAPTSQQATTPPVALSREEQQKREEWRDELSQIPHPKKGCFTAAYPSKEWQEVPCTTTPPYPQARKRGPNH